MSLPRKALGQGWWPIGVSVEVDSGPPAPKLRKGKYHHPAPQVLYQQFFPNLVGPVQLLQLGSRHSPNLFLEEKHHHHQRHCCFVTIIDCESTPAFRRERLLLTVSVDPELCRIASIAAGRRHARLGTLLFGPNPRLEIHNIRASIGNTCKLGPLCDSDSTPPSDPVAVISFASCDLKLADRHARFRIVLDKRGSLRHLL